MRERIESSDEKTRYGRILEVPAISRVQRNCLDAGKVTGVYRIVFPYPYTSLLDVGCGLGEFSCLAKGIYVGIDNSWERVRYAARRYLSKRFVTADARRLPAADKSVDAGMLIDTSHHLTDEECIGVLRELKRVSRKYIFVSDPVRWEGQNGFSSFIYSLDRGNNIRDERQMKTLFESCGGLRLLEARTFRTFPGIYRHETFVLEVENGR
jgi:SAM-dependent methyltransferase